MPPRMPRLRIPTGYKSQPDTPSSPNSAGGTPRIRKISSTSSTAFHIDQNLGTFETLPSSPTASTIVKLEDKLASLEYTVEGIRRDLNNIMRRIDKIAMQYEAHSQQYSPPRTRTRSDTVQGQETISNNVTPTTVSGLGVSPDKGVGLRKVSSQDIQPLAGPLGLKPRHGLPEPRVVPAKNKSTDEMDGTDSSEHGSGGRKEESAGEGRTILDAFTTKVSQHEIGTAEVKNNEKKNKNENHHRSPCQMARDLRDSVKMLIERMGRRAE